MEIFENALKELNEVIELLEMSSEDQKNYLINKHPGDYRYSNLPLYCILAAVQGVASGKLSCLKFELENAHERNLI